MNSVPVMVLVWSSVLGTGLMAGTYFAFSSFIMRAFASMPDNQGMAAMVAINETILRSAFMPLFFISTIVSLLLVIIGLWFWGDPGAFSAFFAGSVYLFGMFGITASENVPMNNKLAEARGGETAPDVWQLYLIRWTRWNSVRAVASGLAFVISVNLVTII